MGGSGGVMPVIERRNSRPSPSAGIPANAGIQHGRRLDPGLRRGDACVGADAPIICDASRGFGEWPSLTTPHYECQAELRTYPSVRLARPIISPYFNRA